MQNKSLVVSIVLIVVIVAGGYFLLKNKAPKGVEVVEETPVVEDEALINEDIIKEESLAPVDNYAMFNVVYPQFTNADVTFNSKIQKTIMEAIASHKSDSAANWKARLDTKLKSEDIGEFPKDSEKLPFETAWMPVQANGDYISFVLLIRAYSGGAHGYENIISFNYDVKAKKELALKDLFPGNSNYLKTVAQFSRAELEKQFKERLEVKTAEDENNFKVSIVPMLDEGTAPTVANFSVFTFTPEVVNIYFTEYQVAPYAMGSSMVTLPR